MLLISALLGILLLILSIDIVQNSHNKTVQDISGSEIEVHFILDKGTLDFLEQNFGKCN